MNGTMFLSYILHSRSMLFLCILVRTSSDKAARHVVKNDVINGTVRICSKIKGHMLVGFKNMMERQKTNDMCPSGMIARRP